VSFYNCGKRVADRIEGFGAIHYDVSNCSDGRDVCAARQFLKRTARAFATVRR
jgi:hypothetical protein